MAEDGPEGDDIADQALHDQLPCQAVGLGKTLVVTDHQKFPVCVGGLNHGFAVGEVGRHGLFTQNVLARIQGCDGQLRMGKVGGADGHGLDFRFCQQLLYGGVGTAAVLSRQLCCPLLIDVVKAHQFCFWMGRVLRNVANLCDFAAADDTDSKHSRFLPIG